MKLIIALITLAAAPMVVGSSAFACPDITGIYECEETGEINLTAQKNKDGVCTLTISEQDDQGTLIADGKWHALDDDEDMQYKSVASTKSFKTRMVDSSEKNPDKARSYIELNFEDSGKDIIVKTVMVYWDPDDKKEERFDETEKCKAQ